MRLFMLKNFLHRRAFDMYEVTVTNRGSSEFVVESKDISSALILKMQELARRQLCWPVLAVV